MSVKIVLADSLVRRVELHLEDSGMHLSVAEFVEMCVREVLGRAELRDAEPLSAEDEAVLEERLKLLGYID